MSLVIMYKQSFNRKPDSAFQQEQLPFNWLPRLDVSAVAVAFVARCQSFIAVQAKVPVTMFVAVFHLHA